MRTRLGFLLGAALGYVAGTRAGRRRYEEMLDTTRRLAESPPVRETARRVGIGASEMASKAADTVTSRAHVMAEEVSDRISSMLPGSTPDVLHVDESSRTPPLRSPVSFPGPASRAMGEGAPSPEKVVPEQSMIEASHLDPGPTLKRDQPEGESLTLRISQEES